jgi:hypothetical protein
MKNMFFSDSCPNPLATAFCQHITEDMAIFQISNISIAEKGFHIGLSGRFIAVSFTIHPLYFSYHFHIVPGTLRVLCITLTGDQMQQPSKSKPPTNDEPNIYRIIYGYSETLDFVNPFDTAFWNCMSTSSSEITLW